MCGLAEFNMSRLIVKNLAKSVTTETLKEIFSQKGVVTDIQLKYTKHGKFRHFGFVGFKSEEDAVQALNYFDSTYINGSRIKVESCVELGAENKPKSWSKYSSDSSAFKKLHPEVQEEVRTNMSKENNSCLDEIVKKYEGDTLFSEFLESRTKGKKIWCNDSVAHKKQEVVGSELMNIIQNTSEKSETEDDGDGDDQNRNVAKMDISDMEYMKMKTKGHYISRNEFYDEIKNEDSSIKKKRSKTKKEKKKEVFFTIKLRGMKYNTKKKDIKEFFCPLKPRSIRRPVEVKGVAYVGFATEKEMKLSLKKHMSFLAGKRISVVKYEGVSKYDPSETRNSKWEEQSESLKSEETIAESGRIFVRNLAYTVTENDIEVLFSKFGPLTEVVMPVDRISRKPKGFAVVTFLMPEHAVKAFSELDGSVFQGRMLHLIAGKMKKSIEELLQMEGLTFKQKKILQMKAQAANSINWNSLFIGQNAVADLIAKNYNTSKEKVLDARGSESLAVRLALGETEIVNATRMFLLDNGVSLDAFNQPPLFRSKTVLLVKNLPAEAKQGEIYQLFAKFGELGRVLLPPSGVTAIVEFLEPSEARAAFRKLAYTKFKHVPLYLEWAPANAFATAFSKKNVTQEVKKKEEIGNADPTYSPKEEPLVEKVNDSSDEDEPPEADTTLFIKNLNFKTEESAIREHFKKCGAIHYITVARKKDGIKAGKLLSMGYGFIQFKKKVSLEKALKSYQNSVLDGNTLELKRSNRTLEGDTGTARKVTKVGKQVSSKILVRNVPFQATQRELRELFKTFGEIKVLRMPLKMAGTGSHRGFAFVEYYTKHDAKRAFKALCQSTHLYGRRLNLEWARTEENIEDLRKKTATLITNQHLSIQTRKATAQFEVNFGTTED